MNSMNHLHISFFVLSFSLSLSLSPFLCLFQCASVCVCVCVCVLCFQVLMAKIADFESYINEVSEWR
jgi:hypothetical protein